MLAADDAHLRCSLVGHDVRQAVAVGDDPFGKQVAHRQASARPYGLPWLTATSLPFRKMRTDRSGVTKGAGAAGACVLPYAIRAIPPPFPCRALPIAGMVP